MRLGATQSIGRRRRGFTLLEMIIVMGAMGVALAMGLALILTANGAARLGETTSGQMARRTELARQFREDVARAKQLPEEFDKYRAGPECLILNLAEGLTVVYQRTSEAMNRIECRGGQESIRQLPFAQAETNLQFTRPKGASGVVTLRLTETRNRLGTTTEEIAAAPGGDLR